MEHSMRLIPQYFDCVKKGTKKIELRLNDEKRQKIKIGDIIIFESVENNPRTLKVKVTNIYHDTSFKNLLNKFPINLFGDATTTYAELIKTLETIYSKKEEEKYGVVGIEITTEIA